MTVLSINIANELKTGTRYKKALFVLALPDFYPNLKIIRNFIFGTY